MYLNNKNQLDCIERKNKIDEIKLDKKSHCRRNVCFGSDSHGIMDNVDSWPNCSNTKLRKQIQK